MPRFAANLSMLFTEVDFPERFAKGRPTVVAELGFGTGLNFLAPASPIEYAEMANARLDVLEMFRGRHT